MNFSKKSTLTARIMIALSKKPKPMKGIEFAKATKRQDRNDETAHQNIVSKKDSAGRSRD